MAKILTVKNNNDNSVNDHYKITEEQAEIINKFLNIKIERGRYAPNIAEFLEGFEIFFEIKDSIDIKDF